MCARIESMFHDVGNGILALKGILYSIKRNWRVFTEEDLDKAIEEAFLQLSRIDRARLECVTKGAKDAT